MALVKTPIYKVGQKFTSKIVGGWTVIILMVSPDTNHMGDFIYFSENLWGEDCKIYNTYNYKQLQEGFELIDESVHDKRK